MPDSGLNWFTMSGRDEDTEVIIGLTGTGPGLVWHKDPEVLTGSSASGVSVAGSQCRGRVRHILVTEGQYAP